jgi:uncharacterized membrane protein YgaE (UPF0421/DUF939 family)
LEKKGLLDRFKRLSKPSGHPQWGHAFRSFILMVIAGLITKFLGFDNAIILVVTVTLLASIIIDISFPIRKVAILALVGFFMTMLAFISASLALSNLEVFIFFTMIWAFFSISLYIFGSSEGSLGFIFFLNYFLAILLLNNQSNTLNWAICSIIPYAVVSILFIPKLWFEKKRINEMITVGFNQGSTIQNIIFTSNILSGIPINSNNYDNFKLGIIFKGLRGYSDLITSRLTSKSKLYFKNFLNASDKFSVKIADHIKNNKGPVEKKMFNNEFLTFESHFLEDKNSNEMVMDVSRSIKNVFYKCNEILLRDPGDEMRKINIPEKSLNEVLTANFNLKNLYIRHAIRFTIAMVFALTLVYLTRERNVIWVTMGVLIILKPDITSTIDNLISRVGFNLFAIIIAIIISFIFPHQLLIWIAVVMLFLFRAFYPNNIGLAVITITVFIVLAWPTGTVYDNAISRLVDIALGGFIAFICAYVILPSRVTVNLPDQLYNTIKSNIIYANQVLIAISNDYNYKKLSESLKNYMMEENNLEAAVKKLDDNLNDITDDITFYQEFILTNNKLSADLTALIGILTENKNTWTVQDTLTSEVKKSLQKLENSLNGDIKPLKLTMDDNSLNYSYNKSKELEQLLNWINFDLKLLIKGIEIADETGLIKRYTKLT